MLSIKWLRRRCSGQAGFTLIEMLVSASAGLIVAFAAWSLIDVTLHSSSKITDRIDATQRGRIAMEQIVQQLSSGCLASDVSPIQPTTAAGISPVITTDASHIVFVTGVGDGSTGTPTEHAITYQNGVLTDTAYTYVGGSAPTLTAPATWTFNPTPRTIRLLSNLWPVKGATGIFKYYTYSNPANTTANSLIGAAPLTALSAPWPPAAGVTNSAGSVAQVDIGWVVGAFPAPGTTLAFPTDPSRLVTMNDSVVFRLTPASSNAANNPCD
jgi:prepilin-type N-terminal cleavage/methylation domain-containing protein